MPLVIALLVLGVVGMVVMGIGMVIGGILMALAFVAAGLTVPSVLAMTPLRLMGLTDPKWYVLLHALLGAAVGFSAHLVRPFFRKARRWPFTEAVARLWRRLTGNRWGIAILILLLVIVVANLAVPVMSLLNNLTR